MEDGRSSLPIAPSTPGGPFGAPIARRVQQLNGAGASKRAKHPLATSFHLPALETPSRPSNGIPSSSKSLEDPTETTLVSADNARWSLSMLAAGVCHQAGFEHVTGGALAELTTELERCKAFPTATHPRRTSLIVSCHTQTFLTRLTPPVPCQSHADDAGLKYGICSRSCSPKARLGRSTSRRRQKKKVCQSMVRFSRSTSIAQDTLASAWASSRPGSPRERPTSSTWSRGCGE